MKGDRTYLISVENADKCVFAGTLVGTRQYIQGLMATARFIEDNKLDRRIRVMPPDRYDQKIFEGKSIKDLADAARYAGIKYSFENDRR